MNNMFKLGSSLGKLLKYKICLQGSYCKYPLHSQIFNIHIKHGFLQDTYHWLYYYFTSEAFRILQFKKQKPLFSNNRQRKVYHSQLALASWRYPLCPSLKVLGCQNAPHTLVMSTIHTCWETGSAVAMVALQPNISRCSRFPSYSRNVRYRLRKNSMCSFFTFIFLGEFQWIIWNMH